MTGKQPEHAREQGALGDAFNPLITDDRYISHKWVLFIQHYHVYDHHNDLAGTAQCIHEMAAGAQLKCTVRLPLKLP